MEDKLRIGAQLLLSWIAAQFMGLSPALWALAAAIAVDTFTGILASWYESTPIRSRDFHRGLITKACILLLCLFGHPMEHFLTVSVGVPIEMNMERWMPVLFTFGEIISIIENFHRCGVPLPGFLIDALIRGRKMLPGTATREQLQELLRPTDQDGPAQ